MAIGDFNGDGKSDLAVANTGSTTVSILLGTGTGTFGAATNFTVGTNPYSVPYSVAIGDFNGDGKSDLAVANTGSTTASILLGTGTGTFGAATNFTVGSAPISVAIGDFNGDGKSDLALANNDSNNVSILLNAFCPEDLSITKTVSGPAFVTQTLTYNIAVTNLGPNDAAAVVVTDVLPAGVTFVSATPTQGSCSGTTTITCNLGAIANPGNASIVLKVIPTAAGPLSNTASVSAAPQPDPNSANDSSTSTVTVAPASNISALGGWAKIMLALTAAFLGLVMMKKE